MSMLVRAGAALLSGAMSLASWGLSFPTPGQAPVPPAGAGELAAYDARYIGDPAENVLYLTFDAGYENGNTAPILDALAAHRAPAAFFLVGNYVQQNPALVRRMVAEGHTVGNHTLSHPDMSAIRDEAAFAAELQGLEALFEETTGHNLSPTTIARPGANIPPRIWPWPSGWATGRCSGVSPTWTGSRTASRTRTPRWRSS